jgi:hypothetical protein
MHLEQRPDIHLVSLILNVVAKCDLLPSFSHFLQVVGEESGTFMTVDSSISVLRLISTSEENRGSSFKWNRKAASLKNQVARFSHIFDKCSLKWLERSNIRRVCPLDALKKIVILDIIVHGCNVYLQSEQLLLETPEDVIR